MSVYKGSKEVEENSGERLVLVRCAQDILTAVVALAAGHEPGAEFARSRYASNLGAQVLERFKHYTSMVVDLEGRINPELMSRLNDALARFCLRSPAERTELIDAALWGDPALGCLSIGEVTGGLISVRDLAEGGASLVADFTATDVAA